MCSCDETSSMVLGRLGDPSLISRDPGGYVRGTDYFSTQGRNRGSCGGRSAERVAKVAMEIHS